ncbi:NTP transferase domain-containing protein [Natronosalvus rutilus]|uniref:NTP transferase domain-containing protein n=1 Tax=Natronosalvus rutilus TaxID=2953753 RepID=A0A9E7NCL9_9EURY|nr:NTP transferase domain-containing protein [Natronosalvus rutilus]UTF55455.1 NTP transferase domain-containing protein [Natronosalvus rutilus]
MAGGRGTRLESRVEKPLYEIGGVAMIDRVLTALEASAVGRITVAVSPNAPDTRDYLVELDCTRSLEVDGVVEPLEPVTPAKPVWVIESAGDGYVSDLGSILESNSIPISTPVLTAAADLPLLEGATVDGVLERYRRRVRARGRDGGTDGEAPSMTVCVPTALKRRLELSVDTTLESDRHLAPTGVNVVGTSNETMIARSYDHRLACNVNRRTDARVAKTYCSDRDRDGEEKEEAFR